MCHYSIIVPHREHAAEFTRQLAPLSAQLERLARPYEIICVDDGSSVETLGQLSELLNHWPRLRILRLDEAVGVSATLTVGIAAARGDVLVAIEPGGHYLVEQIPHLIARLSQLDLVFGRRRLSSWNKFWHRLARIPRGLLLGLEVRNPECLFWAARQEAVAGIQLHGGMRRYLPWLVAKRGFRVGDMYVQETSSRAPLRDATPTPLDLITAWWTCHRWRSDSARELAPSTAPAVTHKLAS